MGDKTHWRDWLGSARVLSIRQPWAWAIVSGTKRIENRTWVTKYRGPILIHASQLRSRRQYDEELGWLRKCLRGPLPSYDEVERGGIVGRATLVDVRENGARPRDKWASPGAIGWHLDDVAPLPFVAMPGRLGLFSLAPAELRRVANGLSKRPRRLRA